MVKSRAKVRYVYNRPISHEAKDADKEKQLQYPVGERPMRLQGPCGSDRNKAKNTEAKDIKEGWIRHMREKGIEPSSPAWEAGILPLNYSRLFKFFLKERAERFRVGAARGFHSLADEELQGPAFPRAVVVSRLRV